MAVLADAHIRGGAFATNNYGAATVLEVRGATTEASTQRAYVKFDLQAFDTITSAQLYLYGRAAQGLRLHAYSVASDSWEENMLTWDNAPALGSLSGSAMVDTAKRWVAIDVTQLAQQEWIKDGLLSVGLIEDDRLDTPITFSSKEAGSAVAPYLVVASGRAENPNDGYGYVFVYDSLAATHDSYVKRGNDANQNYGSEPRLRIKTPSNGNLNLERMAVLQFDVAGYTDVTSAKLLLYGDAESDFILDVHQLASNAWDAATITWNNAPALGDMVGNILVRAGDQQWYEVDITAAFSGGPATLSFGIRDGLGVGDFADFFSSEHPQAAFQPRLLISETDSFTTSLSPGIKTRASFTVVPNPSRGALSIAHVSPRQTPVHYRFELMDQQGRIIQQGEQYTNDGRFERSLDLSSLAEGIYMIRLWAGSQAYVRKVVVQK